MSTKLRDAIRDTLQRNLAILIHGHGSGAPPAARECMTVTVAEVRDMLDACANNLAMVIEELLHE